MVYWFSDSWFFPSIRFTATVQFGRHWSNESHTTPVVSHSTRPGSNLDSVGVVVTLEEFCDDSSLLDVFTTNVGFDENVELVEGTRPRCSEV